MTRAATVLGLGLPTLVASALGYVAGGGGRVEAPASPPGFALLSGLVCLALVPLLPPVFALAGHAPILQRHEVTYASIFLGGSGAAVAMATLSTFFTGRGQTGFRDLGERLAGVGFAAISWGYARGGFLGLGAGAGGQGTQHFAAGGEVIAGGSAEGGLGKIVVELGVPGFVLALICVALVARNLSRILDLAAGSDPALLRLSLGLVAFTAAHVPAFVGAAQIYGDPFVLILLGSSLGFVFAVPRILGLRVRAGSVRLRPSHTVARAKARAQRTRTDRPR